MMPDFILPYMYVKSFEFKHKQNNKKLVLIDSIYDTVIETMKKGTILIISFICDDDNASKKHLIIREIGIDDITCQKPFSYTEFTLYEHIKLKVILRCQSNKEFLKLKLLV